jgi:hypothetical protein
MAGTLHNKYLKNKTLAQVEAKPMDSAFWNGILHVKMFFLRRGLLLLGTANQLGLGRMLGLIKYLLQFNINLCMQYYGKNVRVADVLTQTPLNVGFTRVLRDVRWG